jgi:CarD family transcriptional regulator
LYDIHLRNKSAGQLGAGFVKYEIGDLVSKPVTGICKIEDILYLNLLDEKNKKMYYLIKPIEDEKDKIYVPVSNSDSRLRLCLTKEEAWNLIKRIPEIPTAWVNNEKLREQNYKEAVKANDPEALVAIIKMIYQRKEKRLAQGKKCTATDARYFQLAENLLYMELGVALGKPKQEVCRTIIEYITNNGQ